MGLFDFFKKKEKQEDIEQNNAPANSVILAMPLFKNDETYDIKKVLEHLRTFWLLDVTDDNEVDSETAVFSINGQMVAIAKMPAPVPWEEIEGVAPYNYMWPTALEDLKGHTGHAIVTVMSGGQSPAERYTILSKMLCSILLTSNSVGVYQGTQTLLLSRDYYLQCVEELQNGQIPVPLWIYIGYRPGENKKTSLYTYGMEQFGKREIEIIDSEMDGNDLYSFLLNITDYVISKNVALKDGETIGYSADHKVPLKISKGVYVEGETIKMEL